MGKFINPAIEFLKNHRPVSDIADVLDYVNFIHRESQIDPFLPPVNLEKVVARFGIERQTSSKIQQQGMIWDSEKGIVILNENDGRRRAKFTLAHELIEFLFLQSKGLDPARFRQFGPYSETTKEKMCQVGAAALLMPEEAFFRALNKLEMSFETIENLSNLFDTSFLATTINAIKKANGSYAFAISEVMHKPSDAKAFVPKAQLPLLPDLDASKEPERTLRIAWSISKNRFLPRYKSFDKASLPYKSWETTTPLTGSEFINLGAFEGVFLMQNKPVIRKGETSLFTLFKFSK